MLILSKYLFKQFFKVYLITLVAMIGIFSIFHLLDELGNNYSLLIKLQYIAYSIPAIGNTIFTLAILIAAIIVFGGLNSNKELQIFLTAGLSIKFILIKVIFLTFFFSVSSLTISEIFSPYFTDRALEIKAVASRQTYNKSSNNFWLKQDKKFINMIYDDKRSKQSKISIYELDENNNLVHFLESSEPIFEKNKLTLHHPKKIIIESKGIYQSISKETPIEENYSVFFSNEDLSALSKDLRTLTIYQLIQSIFFSNNFSQGYKGMIVEFFARITKPLYVFGMVLIALPFVLNFDRNRSMGGLIFIGISIAIIFNLVTKILHVLSIDHGFNVYLTSTLPSIFLIIFGFLVVIKKLKKLRDF